MRGVRQAGISTMCVIIAAITADSFTTSAVAAALFIVACVGVGLLPWLP